MSPIKNKNIVTDPHNNASYKENINEYQPENNGIYQHQPKNMTLYGRHMIPN